MKRCWQSWNAYLTKCNGGVMPTTEAEAYVALCFPVGEKDACEAGTIAHGVTVLTSPLAPKGVGMVLTESQLAEAAQCACQAHFVRAS
jgi:hypothetical protein